MVASLLGVVASLLNEKSICSKDMKKMTEQELRMFGEPFSYKSLVRRRRDARI